MTLRPAPLILVVGPSGAGKDSILAAARQLSAEAGRVHFARRVVTRPANGGEDHDSMTPDDFTAAERRGAFLLSWRAHGLAYGIPASLDARRADGWAIVANVSRTVIDDARRRLAPVGVIAITAPIAVLERRLTHRGREGGDDIARRLCRAADPLPGGDDVATVINDATLEAAAAAFLAALRRFHPI